MHRSSFLAMEKFKNKYLEINKSLRILDIGSYDSSDSSFNYSVLFNNDSWELRERTVKFTLLLYTLLYCLNVLQ